MANARSRFVVFTTQRTGSTWLMSVLNTFEEVSAQGELFLPRPRSRDKRWDSDFARARYVESRAQFGSLRPVSVFRYLSAFYDSPNSVGFKLMYSQVMSFPEILLFVMRQKLDVVHLVRRNHLDVLISFALKHKIGQAHILSSADRPTDMAIDLSVRSLLRDLERLQFKQDLGRRVLRLCRLRHIEVAYEDLVADQSHFARLLDFLHIPFEGALPESHILKTRLETQKEVLRNYDEVQRTLAGSQYSHLLE